MYSYSDFILANQPMAYWRFNDPKNSSLVRDYSPNCTHLLTNPEYFHKLGAKSLNEDFLKNDHYIRNVDLTDVELQVTNNELDFSKPLVDMSIPKIVGRTLFEDFYCEFFCNIIAPPPAKGPPPGIVVNISNRADYSSGYYFLRIGNFKIGVFAFPALSGGTSDKQNRLIFTMLYPDSDNRLTICKSDMNTIIDGTKINNEVSLSDIFNKTVYWQVAKIKTTNNISFNFKLILDNDLYSNFDISFPLQTFESVSLEYHKVQIAYCSIANLSVFPSIPVLPNPKESFREQSEKLFKLTYSYKYDPFERTYRHGSQPFNMTGRTVLPFMLDDVLVYGSKQRVFKKIEIKDNIGKIWLWFVDYQAYPKNPFNLGDTLCLEGIPNPPCNQIVKLKQIVNSNTTEILVFDILAPDLTLNNLHGVVKQMPLSWDKSDTAITPYKNLASYSYTSKGRLESENLQQWISQSQGEYTAIENAKSTFISAVNNIEVGQTVPPEELFYSGTPEWWHPAMVQETAASVENAQISYINFTDTKAGDTSVFVNIPEYNGKTWTLPLIKFKNKFKRGNKWYAVWHDRFIRPEVTVKHTYSIWKGTYPMLTCMLPVIIHHEIDLQQGVVYQFGKKFTIDYDPNDFVEEKHLYDQKYLRDRGKERVQFLEVKCGYLEISALLESTDEVNWSFVPNIKPSYYHVYGLLCHTHKLIFYPDSLCIDITKTVRRFHNLEGRYSDNSQGWFNGEYFVVNKDSYDMVLCVAEEYSRYDSLSHYEQSFLYWNESIQWLQNTPDCPIRKLTILNDNAVQVFDIFDLYGYVTPMGTRVTYTCDGFILNAIKLKYNMTEPLLYNTATTEYVATLLYTPQLGLINYTPLLRDMDIKYVPATSFVYKGYHYLVGIKNNGVDYEFFTTQDFNTYTQPRWLHNAINEINSFYEMENPINLYQLTFVNHGVYFYDVKIVPTDGDYHNATQYKFQKYKGKNVLPLPRAIDEYTKAPCAVTTEDMFSVNPIERDREMDTQNISYGGTIYQLFMYDRLNDDNEATGLYWKRRLGLNKYDRLAIINDGIIYVMVSDTLDCIRIFQINELDYVDCALNETPEVSNIKLRELKVDKVFNPTQEPIWYEIDIIRYVGIYEYGTPITMPGKMSVKREDVYFNTEIKKYKGSVVVHQFWASMAYWWIQNIVDAGDKWYMNDPVFSYGLNWKPYGNLLDVKEGGYYLNKNPNFNWNFSSIPDEDLTIFPLKGSKGVLTIEAVYAGQFYKNDTYPIEIELKALNGFKPYTFTMPDMPENLTSTILGDKVIISGFPTENLNFDVILTDNSTDTTTLTIKVQVSKLPTLTYMNRLEFSATDLPNGLWINPTTGTITGKILYTGHKINSTVQASTYRGNNKVKTDSANIDFYVYQTPESIEEFKCYKPDTLEENPIIDIRAPFLNLKITNYRTDLGIIEINAADQKYHYQEILENYEIPIATKMELNLDTTDLIEVRNVVFDRIIKIFSNPQSNVSYVLATANSDIRAIFETSDFINFTLMDHFTPQYYKTRGQFEWDIHPFIDKWIAIAAPNDLMDISDISKNLYVKIGDSWHTTDFFSATDGHIPLVVRFVNNTIVVIAYDTKRRRERSVFLSYDGLDFIEIGHPPRESESDSQYFIDVILGSNNGIYLIDKHNKFYILKTFWDYKIKYIQSPLSLFVTTCKQIEFIDGVLYAILENNSSQSESPFYGKTGLFTVSNLETDSPYADIKWLGFNVDRFYNIAGHCYVIYQGHLILVSPDSFIACNSPMPRYFKGIRNWKFHEPNPQLSIGVLGDNLVVYSRKGEVLKGKLNSFDILSVNFEYINFADSIHQFYYFSEAVNNIHINTTDNLTLQSEYIAPVIAEINVKSPALLNYDGDGQGGQFTVTQLNPQEYEITSTNIPFKKVYWKANYKPEQVSNSRFPFYTIVPYRLNTLKTTTYWTLIGDAQRFYLGMGWYHTSDSNHSLLGYGSVKNLLKDNQQEWFLSGYAVSGVTQFNSEHLMNSDQFTKNILSSGHLLLTGKVQQQSDVTLLVNSNEAGVREYKNISYVGSVIYPPLFKD